MEISCTSGFMSERSFLPQPSYRASVLLPIGLAAISSASILIKVCEAPPLVIAAYRLTLATVVLLLFSLPRTLRELRHLDRREIRLSILAGFFLCFHFAFWVTSLKYTSVASSVIFAATNPIFVALASMLFLQETPSATLLLSILVAMVGSVFIGWGDWDRGIQSLTGDLLALLGAVMATGYLLVGRRVRQKMELTAYITLVYGIAALLLILLALVRGEVFFDYPPRTYFLFILLAFVPQLIGHTTLNWALKFFSAAFVAVFILGEPIGATILAYFTLGEPVSRSLLLGGTLVLLGIYLSAREERN